MDGTLLDLDTIVDLCRDKDRRIALAVLLERQGSLTLDDLAEAIIEHNDDISARQASDETVTRTKTSLYHCHVPKLEDAGIVDFDPEREVVEPEAGLEQIEPHLGTILDDDPDISPSLTP